MTRSDHVAAHGDGAVFTEDWTGPRFRYGYRNRPFAMSHQTRGHIIGAVDVAFRNPVAGVRHGCVDYSFQLSDDEVYSFELVFLGEVTP
jgi:hypothetical protein